MIDSELQRLQNITINYRIDIMRQKAAQAWLDNQQGATIPIFYDNDFKTYFKMFITDAIENNGFWDLWDKLNAI